MYDPNKATPKTDEEAIAKLNKKYDGEAYKALAVAQFQLSRTKGKSIEDSLIDVSDKMIEVCTSVIDKV